MVQKPILLTEVHRQDRSEKMLKDKNSVILIGIPRDDKATLKKTDNINILCINLSDYSLYIQFACCCVFIFIFYLAYGYFLELIYANKEVKHSSLYITLIQFILNSVMSYVESLIRNPIKRQVPLNIYLLMAMLTLGTMACSNLSLSYINYPTQLIFKSCKLIPVMIGSILLLHKKYSFLDYVAAILMCLGLTLFTLADSKSSPNFDALGVLIISLALICDAVIGNVQEKAMKQYQASNNEVVFYSYSIAVIYLLAYIIFNGSLAEGYVYCSKNPKVYLYTLLLSLSGYVGLQAVLTLVRISGATIAVTITTMRKAVSICISFLIFDKVFVYQYLWSGMLVVLAIYVSLYSKRHPNKFPHCSIISKCVLCCKAMYDSEYRHLKSISRSHSSYHV